MQRNYTPDFPWRITSQMNNQPIIVRDSYSLGKPGNSGKCQKQLSFLEKLCNLKQMIKSWKNMEFLKFTDLENIDFYSITFSHRPDEAMSFWTFESFFNEMFDNILLKAIFDILIYMVFKFVK